MQILGKVLINGIEREILLKKEGDLFKYYALDLVGVYTPKIPSANIIFRQDTLENTVSAESKDNEQKGKMIPSEKEQIEEFLQKIKVKDIIERITEQEKQVGEKTQYNQKIKTNEIVKNREEAKSQKQQQVERQPKQIEKEKNNVKDINIKQEVDMDTRVTDMKNLKQILQKANKMPDLEHGDEPLKMGIVESDDLKNLKNEKGQKEQGHSDRYEAVVITKKGEVKSLDLNNDRQEGTNPEEKNYQVKQNSEVKRGDVITRMNVGEGTIGVEKGQYGEVEVYHSPRKTLGGNNIEGNKSLDRQLETSNSKNTLKGTPVETLKLAQKHNDGYRSVEEGYQEVETNKEEQKEFEPKGPEDLDGDMNTESKKQETPEFVQLSSGEKVTYQQLATRWGFYKDGKPDASLIKEKFKQKEAKDQKAEDIIAQLDEEYEDPRAPQKRGR